MDVSQHSVIFKGKTEKKKKKKKERKKEKIKISTTGSQASIKNIRT